MVTYIIRRLLYSVLVLIAASFLVFTFVAKGAGDPLGPSITPNIDQAGLDRIAEEKHLNDSVFVRYGYWAEAAVTNGFGDTLLTNKPILPDLWRVMKNTLQLVIVAELLAILIAIGIGVLSALRQYSVFDYTATTFSFLGLAMPLFWLALMLVVLNVQIQGWTGTRSFPSPTSTTSTRAAASASGSTAPTPGPAHHGADDCEHRDVLALHARLDARGRERRLRAHGARQGAHRAQGDVRPRVPQRARPLVTVIALNFGALIGGAVVTETVFSLDGMGLYFIGALGGADPYPVMAWLMVTATMVIVFNLIADILYGVLDPRVRYD